MPFIKNMWYVAAWSYELGSDAPIARMIIGESIAFYRKRDGTVVAIEDRCPHRHAPLSLGRVEGDDLRCMYHGLKFGCDGVCIAIPGMDNATPNIAARIFPVVEQSSWLWVWPGNPAKADRALIPRATGLDDPEWSMRADAMDYAADYQLVNDNLCDLSHLDFSHETTLGGASGAKWSQGEPTITPLQNGLLFERWFTNVLRTPSATDHVDTWNSYQYLLPGLFLMKTETFPAGTALASNFAASTATPMFRRREQQAVTPIAKNRTRYLYASGVEAAFATPEFMDGLFGIINAAFAEDKRIIEGQQKIWDATPADQTKTFIPQDKAPNLFRRLIARRLADEASSAVTTEAPRQGPRSLSQ